MSVKAMAWVWDESQASGSDLLVLLAIADAADHDGTNAWPSIATLAAKTRLSERTVQRSIRALVDLGELEVQEQAGGFAGMRSDRRPNRYWVLMAPADDGVTDRHPEADGVTSGAVRGDNQRADGVTLVTPNPSLDPSIDPSPTSGDVVALDALGSRPEVDRLCDLLADLVAENGSKRPTVTKTWRSACRLMIDKDGREPEKIERAIRWVQRDEFWRANILSMPKLREKYDQVRLQALRKAQGRRPVTGDPDQTAQVAKDWLDQRRNAG